MEQRSASKVFFVVLLGSVALLITLFWNYISCIILAMLITSVSYPMYQGIRRLLGRREQAAALTSTLVVLVILVIPVSWFVGTLSQEAFQFYDRTRSAVSLQKLQGILEKDSGWVESLKKWGEGTGLFTLTPESVEKMVSSVGRSVGLFLYKQLTAAAGNLFSFLIHFFLMILTVYYLYRDGRRLKEYLIQLIPLPREQLEKLAFKFTDMGRAIVIGNGLSGIIQGILGGLGFFLFGLESPFLWGTVIAFMAFLPIIGASIVFIPAAVILAIQGEVFLALVFLAYNVCYSSLMEYVIKPRMIGKGMQMNALLVFVGIIGGIKIFGILGILYGPLIITVFLTLAEIYRLEYKDRTA